jgi:hypothetical protein
MRPRILSLCTGFGALDHAAQDVFDAELVAVSDIDPGACKILAHRYPGIPNLGDLKLIDWEEVTCLMPAPRNDALAQVMYDRYCQGLSIEGVADEFGRTRQTVHKMFQRRGFSLRPAYHTLRDVVTYQGRNYTLGDLGYLRCTTGDRHYLHRRVWEDHRGPIPPDYDIHHKDHNKLNNDITNLVMLTKADHTRLHAEEVVPLDSPVIDIMTAGYP